MKKLIVFVCLLWILGPVLGQETNEKIRVKSNADFKQTLDKLQEVIQAKGLNIFEVIDHAEGAEKADMVLRPTSVVIFGNPMVGTLLMNCDQSIGLELPLKILVYKGEDGSTYLAYEPPETYLKKYKLAECTDVIKKVSLALGAITSLAAQ